jgi:hypothetical protein
MAKLKSHFEAVAGPPKPLELSRLFGGSGLNSSYTSNTSDLLQQLIEQVNDQTSVLNELVGTLSGKSGGSAVQNILGGTAFSGSVLGGVAQAAKGGSSWKSILKDIFPVGGLISGIASLFDSPPTPPPLEQYAAPPALNFNAVLNSNGTLSQGSTNQYGNTRASSPGLDLLDAVAGPYSPYQRAQNGSLVPVAGNPTSLYSSSLNLPEFVQNASTVNAPGLVQISGAGTASLDQGFMNTSQQLKALIDSTVNGSPNASPSRPVRSTPSFANATEKAMDSFGPAASSTNQATGNIALPAFDQEWFNDHGSQIANAVRTELLNYHPIVDTINDL